MKTSSGEDRKRSGVGVTGKQTGCTRDRETEGVRMFCGSGFAIACEKLKLR